MTNKELRDNFSKDFFEEFKHEAEFHNILYSLATGSSPYQIIEHLCKSKKQLIEMLLKSKENDCSTKIFMTKEEYEKLKGTNNEQNTHN